MSRGPVGHEPPVRPRSEARTASSDRLDRVLPSHDLSIRYTERLVEAGAVTSVGSRGDSYDTALAESVIGLYKAELERRRGPWRGLDDLELATLEWIGWYNHRRLHSALDYLPPAEYERNQGRAMVPAGAETQ